MKMILMTGIVAIGLGGWGHFADAVGTSAASMGQIDNANKTSQVGVGLEVGSQVGLTLDYWLTDFRALNASFAIESGNTALSLAHIWVARNMFSGSANALAPYIGAGLQAVWGTHGDYFDRREFDSQDFALGAQVPLGLQFLPKTQRFAVFGELAPGIQLVPDTAVGFLTGDVGARFYF